MSLMLKKLNIKECLILYRVRWQIDIQIVEKSLRII